MTVTVRKSADLPPRNCSPFARGPSKFFMNRAQSAQDAAYSDLAKVESVVAYPQSRAAIQKSANARAPPAVCVIPTAVRVGGFSAGRTFGPVVAIEGDVGGGAIEEVGGV